MPLTKKEYEELNKKASKNSKAGKNILMAFLIGGLICTIGQLLFTLYSVQGLDTDTAYATVSITLVFAAAFLTGLNVYDNIAKVAGAGTLVPITGFSNAVASPAMEFKSEGLILGMGAKMFIIAGPVIVYGILASSLYGLIIYFFHLY